MANNDSHARPAFLVRKFIDKKICNYNKLAIVSVNGAHLSKLACLS